jgi:very-short-patch-repair endonuclease
MWLGVLHAGGEATISGLTAAELCGLRGWHRDEVTILVPHGADLRQAVDNVRFEQTRRALAPLRKTSSALPVCQVEPAVLLFGASQPSSRTAEGVVAAVVQQQLSTSDRLLSWLDRLGHLRHARQVRRALHDIAGGAQSVAEIDVARMCRSNGLALPQRQTRRRDAAGRLRFTDCEWLLPDSRVLVLEVDGSFHMQTAHWEDDLARQRGLTAEGRSIVRCTSRELRDEPELLAIELLTLGVPRAA